MHGRSISFNLCTTSVIKNLEVIHYGNSHFEKAKFQRIQNFSLGHERGGIKPFGGLWTSPKYSTLSWSDYCQLEGLETSFSRNLFCAGFTLGAQVAVIDSYNDLCNLPFRSDSIYVDWEEVAKYVDAIWLTEKGLIETSLSRPYHLSGFDCETVLIMNSNAIEPIGKSS